MAHLGDGGRPSWRPLIWGSPAATVAPEPQGSPERPGTAVETPGFICALGGPRNGDSIGRCTDGLRTRPGEPAWSAPARWRRASWWGRRPRRRGFDARCTLFVVATQHPAR